MTIYLCSFTNIIPIYDNQYLVKEIYRCKVSSWGKVSSHFLGEKCLGLVTQFPNLASSLIKIKIHLLCPGLLYEPFTFLERMEELDKLYLLSKNDVYCHSVTNVSTFENIINQEHYRPVNTVIRITNFLLQLI